MEEEGCTVNYLRYAGDTTLIADNKVNWLKLIESMKKESKMVGPLRGGSRKRRFTSMEEKHG